MKIYNKEYDKRSDCYLVLATMPLSEYKNLVENAFKNKGNLNGQRDVISRSSIATKIRNRMAEDFKKGAVLPQVVIGLLLNENNFSIIKNIKDEGKDEDFIEVVNIIKNIEPESISIIDGMQRTNVYFENYKGNENYHIRVEFYITTSMTKLLYRMLVLNTGQVPWNTRRQLEVIYSHLEKSVMCAVKNKNPELANKIIINAIDDKKRRTQSGVFNKSALIEMYLSFNTRNTKVNLSNEIAEELQRFDMIESIEKEENFSFFIEIFILLCRFDLTLGAYPINNEDDDTILLDHIDVKESPIKQGKNFFTNIPIIMGFMAACADYVLGAVNALRTLETKNKKLEIVKKHFDYIINKIETDKNTGYMDFDILNSALSSLSKKGNIGENQRKYFKDVFISIIKYDDLSELPTLASLWRES